MSLLLLLRHAHARNAEAWAPREDDLRPLTGRGRKAVRLLVKRLHKLDAAPDAILHSPLVRAAQTAELLAEGLGCPDARVECEALRGDVPAAACLEVLAAHLADAGLVVAVGHQPSLSLLASLLLAGDESAVSVDLRKAGWCLLSARSWEPGGRATLVAHENPDAFAATADGGAP